MDQDRLLEDVKRTAEYFRAEAAELRRCLAALERERNTLHEAMREVCHAIGGYTTDGTSVEFLAYVPESVRLTVGKLERELAEARKDRARLEKATEFDLGPMPGQPEHCSNRVHVVRCEGYMLPKQPYMWAVRCSGNVLAKDGEWEYEPLPSSRDDEFYARCRFDTLEEAWAAALAAIDAAMGGE